MKIFIASDIHGSKYYAQKLVERFDLEKADKMVLLGDIYYHGPRNPFPKDYSPMEVANILNQIKEKLLVIKGNCDSEVDQMVSEFTFVEEAQILLDGISILLTHGHKINSDCMPKEDVNILAYGHFHVNFMKKIGKTLVVNPGSISLPKENSIQGYITIENRVIKQFDIDGNLIETMAI